MSGGSILRDLPGGEALCQWFGSTPSFHDAELLRLDLMPGAACALVLHTWRLTDVVDPNGFFVLDKHAVVTITLDEVTAVALSEFEFALPAILSKLEIERRGDTLCITWDIAYGVSGSLNAKRVRLGTTPGKP